MTPDSPQVAAATETTPMRFESRDIPLDDLLLDPNNYRFLDNRGYKPKPQNRYASDKVQLATLRLLAQDKRYQLDELKKSILTNGYVPMERIIVSPYDPKPGKFLVIEGNRRVAALKSLLQEDEEGVRELTPDQIESFSKIPCAILMVEEEHRTHAARVIMGIRHITGPREWGAYTRSVIDDFLETNLNRLQDALVTEYNDRSSGGGSIRYSFADDDGLLIQGIGGLVQNDKIAFQDGINSLTPAEFEAFSAYLLRLAACTRVWKTQETHDEGLDAFGYMPYFQINQIWAGAQPEVVFLAQAKHYNDCKVGSRDIREFVGSSRLASLKIYSKFDERYKDLEIKPLAPVALVFVTTQEVPRTVKHMARSAGIVVLTSDDLCVLFCSTVETLPNPLTSGWIAEEIRTLCRNIPKAK